MESAYLHMELWHGLTDCVTMLGRTLGRTGKGCTSPSRSQNSGVGANKETKNSLFAPAPFLLEF